MSFYRIILVLLLLLFRVAEAKAISVMVDAKMVNDWAAKMNPNADPDIGPAVIAASRKHDVSPSRIVAFMQIESMFRTNVVSSEGASGLMQIIPRYHRQNLGGKSAFDVNANINAGTAFIKYCQDKRGKNIASVVRCYTGGYGSPYISKLRKHQAEFLNFVIAKGRP